MKKTLLFVAMTVLILNATGCGSCRNRLFGGNQTMAAPMVGQVQQCAPMCQPVCCPQPCDPCCSGTPMTVGYGGGAMMGSSMGMGMDGGCACGQ